MTTRRPKSNTETPESDAKKTLGSNGNGAKRRQSKSRRASSSSEKPARQTSRERGNDVRSGAVRKAASKADDSNGARSNGTSQKNAGTTAESPAKWTFLTNHAHVLIVLDAEPDLVLRHVAQRVGITERAVQRIIGDLSDSGFLEIKRVGRKNHYRVLKANPLRHPIEAHRTIGDLLDVIANHG